MLAELPNKGRRFGAKVHKGLSAGVSRYVFAIGVPETDPVVGKTDGTTVLQQQLEPDRIGRVIHQNNPFTEVPQAVLIKKALHRTCARPAGVGRVHEYAYVLADAPRAIESRMLGRKDVRGPYGVICLGGGERVKVNGSQCLSDRINIACRGKPRSWVPWFALSGGGTNIRQSTDVCPGCCQRRRCVGHEHFHRWSGRQISLLEILCVCGRHALLMAAARQGDKEKLQPCHYRRPCSPTVP